MSKNIVLITDDDEDDRYFLRQSIEGNIPNVTVLEAFNGEDALKMLAQANGEVDLVLLDMNMPGLTGLDVLDQIRSTSNLENTPTVIISTSSEPDLVKKAYSKGVNSFIKKPFSVDRYNHIANAIKVCFLDTPQDV